MTRCQEVRKVVAQEAQKLYVLCHKLAEKGQNQVTAEQLEEIADRLRAAVARCQ